MVLFIYLFSSHGFGRSIFHLFNVPRGECECGKYSPAESQSLLRPEGGTKTVKLQVSLGLLCSRRLPSFFCQTVYQLSDVLFFSSFLLIKILSKLQ